MDVRERVFKITGDRVVELVELTDAGGYTPALRTIATLSSGSTVFVKAAVDESTAAWIQAERAAYESLGPRSFMPGYVGADDQVLVLEDLRGGRWPPPWQLQDFDGVFAMLDLVGSTSAPSWVADCNDLRGDLLHLWRGIDANPNPLLRLGVCGSRWLSTAVPVLAEAAARATVSGDGIVNFDVRGDNLCFFPDRALLVDWNLLCRGNPLVDRVFFAQTVAMDGGPPP